MTRMTARKDGAHDVPDGQPRAWPRTVLKGKEQLPSFKYPHQVVRIKNKKDLDQALEHYGHPLPMFEGSGHVKNTHAMRHIVEWVFPTLRWFCKVYHVDIPDWLKGHGWAEGIADNEHKRFFGEEPLDVKEWHEKKKHAGKRL